MKALQIIEETDPQGTVVGVLGVVNLPSRSRQLPAFIRRIPQLLRYAGLAAAIIILLFACLQISGDAFTLQESGRFSGAGYHEISASGPLCSITLRPGNASLLEAENGTVWMVLQNGSLLVVV